MSNKFKVVFTGEVMEGFSLEEAKSSIKESFKLNDEQLDKIFVGRPIVVKRNVDYEAAENFKSFFDKAGASCQIYENEATITRVNLQSQDRVASGVPERDDSIKQSGGLGMASVDHGNESPTESSLEKRIAPPPKKVACSECGARYQQNEMMPYKDSWVCAKCKPAFTQKLKEGVSLVTDMDYAGFWIRFGAKFIDGIILGILNAVISLMAAPFMIPATEDPENVGNFMAINIIVWLLQMTVDISYVTFFLGKFAATPGKMACKLKVVTGEGDTVTYLRAFGRYFAEMLSAIILGIGYLMAAFDDEKRTLHDRICNTRVIRK